MGWAKELYIEYLEFERTAAHEEAQSRLRLSMACTELARPLSYDLHVCILELAQISARSNAALRVTLPAC